MATQASIFFIFFVRASGHVTRILPLFMVLVAVARVSVGGAQFPETSPNHSADLEVR